MQAITILRFSFAPMVLFSACALAPAATITWTNTTGGNWSVAANWSPNQLPGASDTALITTPGTYAVTLDTSPTVADVTLGASSGVSTQSLFINGQVFTITNALVTSRGVVNLNGAGYIIVNGSYTVAGTFNWTSGYLYGPGTVMIATNGTWLMNSAAAVEVYSTVVLNAGTVRWTAGDFYLLESSTFTNLPGALFDVQGNLNMYLTYGVNVFINQGTCRKSAGSGNLNVQLPFVNSGTLEAQTGTIVFGSYGGVFSSGSTFTGAGTTRLTGGTFAMNGTINSSNLVIDGSIVNGTYTIVGTLTCSSGYLDGPGVVTIATNSTLLVNPQSSFQVRFTNVVVNAGTVIWMSGEIYLSSGSIVTNLPDALFDARSDGHIFLGAGVGPAVFDNSGTFRKSAGAGTTEGAQGGNFVNRGIVSAQSGTLLFSSSFTNPAGTIAVSGGSAIQFAQPLVLPDGLLTGSGTIQAPSITSAATVSPGASNAVLTLSGNYTQLYNGSIEFDIGGTLPGTDQSQVRVTGAAQIDGLIGLRFSPGYSPAVGSSNLVLTANPLNGTFHCYDHFMLLGQNERMLAAYNPTNLTLIPVSAPDPTGPSLGFSAHDQMLVCWPAEFTNFGLYFNTNLASSSWRAIPGPTNRYLDSFSSAPQKFFRLQQSP